MTAAAAAARLRRWLPRRPPQAHKGDFGHVLLVAGSRGMPGAAVLAARAALRSGAGLVTAAVPAGIHPIAASQVPEMLTLPMPETRSGALAPGAVVLLREAHLRRPYTLLAIGPGLSTDPAAAAAILAILGGLGLPAVVDADALNVLAVQPRGASERIVRGRRAPCLFTPHPGEMARLLRTSAREVQADRAAAAKKLAGAYGVICLLKGRRTIITDGTRSCVNPTGNSGLAKGGTGDVLTGLIAGLWAQRLAAVKRGMDPVRQKSCGFEAAALGAYLHGVGADIAVREKTRYALLAGDVIEALPRAFRALR